MGRCIQSSGAKNNGLLYDIIASQDISYHNVILQLVHNIRGSFLLPKSNIIGTTKQS